MNQQLSIGNHYTSFLAQKRVQQWFLLGFLFVTAVATRAYGIFDLPFDFHPARQYRSALIARAYYYERSADIPAWQKEVAFVNSQNEGLLEPPVVEYIAAFAYTLVGGEHLWIPKLLSSLFWVIGGIFLYFLARDLASFDAAALTVAFYLFLPSPILISQSFQPDPLMVMLMIMSLFLIVRQHQNPATTTFLLAAFISGTAILVKPIAVFIIFGGFLALAIYQHRNYTLFLRLHFWVFTGVSLLPAFLFYGYTFFISGDLQGQASNSFIPGLLLELYFWQFWLKHIYRIIGFAAFLGGMVGVLLFIPDWRRLMMIGLWVGYLIYGMIFNYHIHTHDYYQLPFVPVVALSLGPLGALLLKNFNELHTHWLPRAFMGGILLLAIFLHIGLFLRERQEMPDPAAEVRLAEEIGARVNHSTHTLILAPYSGSPLKYHGEIAGWPWPTYGDINAERLSGMLELSVEARFAALQAIHKPDYFIVTDFAEYKAQEDLQTFLTTHFPVVLQGENYLVFGLQGGD